MRVHYVIGGVVTGIVLLLCLGLILIFCCCRKKKAMKKEYEMGRGQSQVVPPPYFTNGMENKGLERSTDAMDDALKNFNSQTGYISYSGHIQPSGNPAIPYIDQASYSNSHNGGSVDSQDSLWKTAMPGDPSHSNMLSRTDYEHQQFVEEYMPYHDNRNNYVSDPYGPIPKPKRRVDLIGDSPYHELSGLPDPYLETQQEDLVSSNNRTQQVTMSFEEPRESGYSTPNSRTRRVIREIIV
ncbi:unnamed protein product [Allacma fusca]|uniref:Uncharacterized protein n=1 Tax=Allacma fusca TaxID=39272 RepID=A0A8J2KSH9_9HEXA|nr:unnamed protein product [Allacma fusca]